MNTLKNTYLNPNSENIRSCIRLLKEYSGPPLKENALIQNCLKIKWLEKEFKLINRANIQACHEYFQYFLDQRLIRRISTKNAIKCSVATLFDYLPETIEGEDMSFIRAYTNTLPSFAHLKQAEELFYKKNIRKQDMNNYGSDILVIYSMRLVLEKRIKAILGIDYAVDANKNPISLSKFLHIIEKLESIEFHADISWQNIKTLNTWLNHYMHRCLRPEPWSIHLGFQIIDSILKPIKTFDNGRLIGFHWYGTTKVKDLEELRNEIRSKLPNSTIEWLSKPELKIENDPK